MTSFSEDRIQLADKLANVEVAEGKKLRAYAYSPSRFTVPAIYVDHDEPAFTAGQTSRSLRVHYRVLIALSAVNEGAAEQNLNDYSTELVIALVNERYAVQSVSSAQAIDFGDGQTLIGVEIRADHNLSLS